MHADAMTTPGGGVAGRGNQATGNRMTDRDLYLSTSEREESLSSDL